jgi:hypothetical protein
VGKTNLLRVGRIKLKTENVSEIIPLKEIFYDKRARDGYWCCLPYPLHTHGCPKFPECPSKHVDFLEVKHKYDWFAVVVNFDLKAHADRMQVTHTNWSRRQAKCVLYWQNKVVKELERKANSLNADIILERPEASGVNLFVTMAKVGINLKPNPDFVRKIFFVGWQKSL